MLPFAKPVIGIVQINRVFARGDRRDRVDTGVDDIGPLPTVSSLLGISADATDCELRVYPRRRRSASTARESFTFQLSRTPIVGSALVTVKT